MGVKLAAKIIKTGAMAKYVTTMDIFLQLRDGFKHNHSELSAIEQYLFPPFLVIDAMEVRGETRLEDQILDQILDKRYGAKKDTLLISNQKTEEFQKSIGPSIASRLKETGGIVECNWEGFR